MTNQRFEALSRILLNNWHYINRKTLSFHQEINFFTGHSGSGKSTVIDAMQILLYANTDGRGFFNKAAADDSDRNLIEYLRGMVNIGENNEFAYLRNQNFSTTIVLELKRTDTEDCQCVGVVFDVETSTNQISRKFFWHKGPLWENEYRTEKRAMAIEEVMSYLQTFYGKEDYFATSHNERFRRQLYDVYLGGLDSEKFPLLFKRAIPFRMNIRLEDFVREYICMEQDIHIEDMQESVMQYGRMRKKIEDTSVEIGILKDISQKYAVIQELEEEIRKNQYFFQKAEMLDLQTRIKALADKVFLAKKDLSRQEKEKSDLEVQIQELTGQGEELLRRISSTGYEDLKNQLDSTQELVIHLQKSADKWTQTAKRLLEWIEEETTSNQTIWDIEAFEKKEVDEEGILRLKRLIAEMQKEMEDAKKEAEGILRDIRKKERQTNEELLQLKAGNKAYPKYLERARSIIQKRLLEETKKAVEVHVLADLLDIRDDTWRNAVEGYLGNNKLSLVVPPAYAKTALLIYEELDRNEYYNVTVLDTEKASDTTSKTVEHSLAEEVIAGESYLKPYIDLLFGRVVKCQNVMELRNSKVGVTPECMLYHNFRLQHMNPDHYTKYAYIGKDSVRRRIRLLEKSLVSMEEEKKEPETTVKECERILSMEALGEDVLVYLEWQQDISSLKMKEKEKRRLEQKLEQIKAQNVSEWEKERDAVLKVCEEKREKQRIVERQMFECTSRIKGFEREILQIEEELAWKTKSLEVCDDLEEEGRAWFETSETLRYDRLKDQFFSAVKEKEESREEAFQVLMSARGEYARRYPNRNCSLTAKENEEYDRLLEIMECTNLEEYKIRAAEQAKSAVLHFKDDFMFKIRSAIKDALQRRDELNRIISRLDFGKDKYQFVIGKNKGPDGRYFDMFMDDSLDVNPSHLTDGDHDQMNLFTMEHENQYGEVINDLIHIFIPPDNATPEQMEEAKRNMDRYADYRTYLSFDMQQIIQNDDEVIKIRLSKMLKKNSGGEGQNPLYVALLASFAQAYRINLSPKVQRNPTIRLVVLDEAFSKMDAEKVASCIELIRGLGFQAIISATNDKIQNYVENVDKTFVFANPNKKSISIQEFERESFPELMKDLDEEE
ncbi:SbcC/MukB-like Walker B domain-containing protein [Clostridium sp. HBUAS56010]|uniref:ATP-binding protein n=1 Tax=Clostridium sp. HBUAS56010 TaxID=2571127 RepID=UPI0011777B2C|nr:SbcC/MukB-like Walker B domain-containing protein [Clostridium sp. HBUAS56010]